jgi:general secretion pathway protein L
VLDQPLRSGSGRMMDTPCVLRAVLLSAGAAATIALLVAAYLGDSFDSEQQELFSISQRRAALRLGPEGISAYGLLAKRKQTSPSSAVVLEALPQALPEGTYVTELRIDGDKVQVVGMTQDAPSLIRLIEKSPQFAPRDFLRANHARFRPNLTCRVRTPKPASLAWLRTANSTNRHCKSCSTISKPECRSCSSTSSTFS